jgi:L-cysteine S-thiosulfotransferase
MPKCPALWALVLLLAAPACDTGRRSPAGFRLPAGGDVQRGKTAFVALGCVRCHDVAGVDLPAPGARTRSVLLLGGEVSREPGDGRLVRSIIAPSPERRSGVAMPHYDEQMTVRQLTDIVAFLQSRYAMRPMPARWGNYY